MKKKYIVKLFNMFVEIINNFASEQLLLKKKNELFHVENASNLT